MASPRDRVTRGGKTLTRRVWDLLADAGRDAGLPIRVLQGSYHRGVSQSAGTHNGGGAFDLSVRGMSERQAITLVVALRRRNVAAWLRSPKYGWPARLSGSHIHGIVKDEPGLSAGARAQVVAYNQGRNGLASHARDPFPRPAQRPFHGAVDRVSSAAHVRLANLRYGKTNSDVKDLQRVLGVAVDGVYGRQTDAAVRADQRRRGWTPDRALHSYVGPRQCRALGLVVD